ncbi:hypothetical protein [Streptomyces sp. NPDC089799]|uniref:hypothetical protein n=1 Tax=Streptomyces sp. NPDC089799 TaxID=3155066 RepID=UPI0034290042
MISVDFPQDLIRLKQNQISLYNRMTADPALRTTLAADLVRAGLAVSGERACLPRPASRHKGRPSMLSERGGTFDVHPAPPTAARQEDAEITGNEV